MRQIEKQLVAAVKARHSMSVSNTQVVVKDNCCDVLLFGNHIARIWDDGRAEFTLAGWNSNTTRSRLRALGVDVCQKDWSLYFDGKAITSTGWYEFEFRV